MVDEFGLRKSSDEVSYGCIVSDRTVAYEAIGDMNL